MTALLAYGIDLGPVKLGLDYAGWYDDEAPNPDYVIMAIERVTKVLGPEGADEIAFIRHGTVSDPHIILAPRWLVVSASTVAPQRVYERLAEVPARTYAEIQTLLARVLDALGVTPDEPEPTWLLAVWTA